MKTWNPLQFLAVGGEEKVGGLWGSGWRVGKKGRRSKLGREATVDNGERVW